MKYSKTSLLRALFIEKRLPYRYKKYLEIYFVILAFYIQYYLFSLLDILFMKNNPGISIVIPCYNQGKYLKETVKSAINQSYKNIEIIIIDDHSNDNTILIANNLKNKYPHKNIRVLKNGTNKGLAKTRNIGIESASNKLIYLLDGDDKINSNTLSILYKFMKYRKASFVSPGMIKFGYINKRHWKLKFDKKNQPFINSFITVGLLKKSAWQKSGGFNPNMKYGWEDWDFSLSLIENNFKIIDAAKPLYYYRRKTESMLSSLRNNEKHKRDMIIQLIKNHPNLYLNYSIKELVSKFSYRISNVKLLQTELESNLY